jgi:hypothetical protein
MNRGSRRITDVPSDARLALGEAATLDCSPREENMTNGISRGMAARTLRILGMLGALAISTSAGAQQVRSDAQRADSARAQKKGSAKNPSASGGLSGGVLKQGGAKQPGVSGALPGGVTMKQGAAKKPAASGGASGGVLKQGKSAGSRSQVR